jgi:hypothetical protein
MTKENLRSSINLRNFKKLRKKKKFRQCGLAGLVWERKWFSLRLYTRIIYAHAWYPRIRTLSSD